MEPRDALFYSYFIGSYPHILGKSQKNLEMLLTAEQYKRTEFHADYADIGLICKEGTLDVDTDALTKATTVFLSELPQKAEQYSKWLTENRIDAALCDMPIWSIEACELAGVPLLYVGNFTWAELYREFLTVTVCLRTGQQ